MLKPFYTQNGETSKSAIILTLTVAVVSVILIIWAIQGVLTPDKVKESGIIEWLQTGGALYILDGIRKMKGPTTVNNGADSTKPS